MLTAGADDHVWIGNVGRVQMRAETLGRDVVRRQTAGGNFGRELPRRTRDLLAGAVVERDHQREPVVVAGQILGFLQQEANIAVEIVALADDAHAHIALVQLGQVLADEAAQQTHQIGDFRGGRDQFSELKEKMVR